MQSRFVFRLNLVFARGMSDGFPKFIKSEGALGLYKGLVPLWGRQIPCKFKLTIQFSEDYPNKPPAVRFVSLMFHPNSCHL
ncbi:mitochondrial phosphate carrier protein 1, mitochondrial-like isoform X4 [Actinidia eriantha]|uniref:mitochondrial phosphate carrier protein 1, mitochondrial-like isoform X4 n=1 Tax=Actinidia eriantha TaxID=165200 RepID=UPI00258BFB0C|nr:mitochondrial phosphate carrier protein 1, mitochondrial-like isoform X4 [Actinidia eriantha]